MARLAFAEMLELLEQKYGRPKPPGLTDPWRLILWENVAYLADDDRRLEAFRTLKKRVGTKPEAIQSAADEVLLEVTRHGIMPELFAQKLRRGAAIALKDFSGDLQPLLTWPLPRALKALRKFPGIGAPGAEKLLLFCGAVPVLALESNGLRVLVRLGFGAEKKSYDATYRSVRETVEEELEKDCAWLVRAHQLLRQHGQETCRRSKPVCDHCPLAADCSYFQTARRKG